jgi:hypothetical protein
MTIEAIIIAALMICVFGLMWNNLTIADKILVRDEALDWLSDNGHMTKEARNHVIAMLEVAE